jgi:hypothetical protein
LSYGRRRRSVSAQARLRITPSDRRRVLRNQRVGGQQGDAFDHRLHDQDAVIRILVYWRQIVERDGVFAGDRQLIITVIQETAAQKPGVGPKIAATEAVLDRDLPQAGRTEDRLVPRIVEQLAGGGWQPVRLRGSP